jgi:hypothetical protein
VDGGSQDAAASDADAGDAAIPVGTISGVAINYSQANGKGVLAGATVSISVPSNPSANIPNVTTDANGVFSIANVPAGMPVQVAVTKPTDVANGIAYSRSFSVVTLASGQTLNLFPIVHEGCFQTYAFSGSSGLDAAANEPVTLQNAQCPGGPARTGAYAAMTFDSTSFSDCGGAACTATSPIWTHGIRVEMIPLAYPSNGGTPDLSWALGLPGSTTPPGLLGAVEYRVIGVDPGQPDDGDELGLSPAAQGGTGVHAVGIAVPVYTAPSTAAAFSYDPSAATWSPEATATPTIVPGADAGIAVQYQTMIVTHIAPATWWGIANGTATTTCVTGTVAGAATGTSVFVRAAGSNYLGNSTATTSGGAFCMNVNAPSASTLIEVFAGAVSGGVPSSGLQSGITISQGDAGTCGNPASCSAIGTITLTDGLSCVAGDVTTEDASTVPSALNVFESFTVTAADQAAGIQPTAYMGQSTIGAGGAFCALGAPGGTVYLSDPNQCNFTSSVPVPLGSNAPACAAGGCADAGGLLLNCP